MVAINYGDFQVAKYTVLYGYGIWSLRLNKEIRLLMLETRFRGEYLVPRGRK
jgi:hypothetical protein